MIIIIIIATTTLIIIISNFLDIAIMVRNLLNLMVVIIKDLKVRHITTINLDFFIIKSKAY